MNRSLLKNCIPRKFAFGMLLLLLSFSFLSGMSTESKAITVPDFTIDTLQGSFTLSEHLGKTVILFFSFPG